jgi:hypothetical protein
MLIIANSKDFELLQKTDSINSISTVPIGSKTMNSSYEDIIIKKIIHLQYNILCLQKVH